MTGRTRTTTAELAERASALVGAVERLEAFGVTVDGSSRLREAISAIFAVVASGEFPAIPSHISVLVNALEIAEDFSAISSHLPKTGEAETRKQLQIAVKGTLAALEAERAPFRYQSQHWIGSVLLDAGLNPRLPTDTTRENPDFLVTYLTSTYGVEVKRPIFGKNIPAGVTKAANQLMSYNVYGCIFVDVTDCVREHPEESVQLQVARYSDVMNDLVWNDELSRHQPGFGHVMILAAYARGSWRFYDGPTPHVARENHVALQTYSRTAGNAVDHAAHSIKDAVLSAMEGNDMSVTLAPR